MKEDEPVERIRVTIFTWRGVWRVHPATVFAAPGDEIHFFPIGVDVEIFLPPGVARTGPIGVGSGESQGVTVNNSPGVYSYVVVCKDGSEYESAVANSDPIIIVGRRP
jgi:plastocyanin